MFTKIKNNPKKSLFLFGFLLSLAFAPLFFVPLLLLIAFLAYFIKNAESVSEAAAYGCCFGFGFFTSNLYWISVGVSVYINDFWWALPFALFGLPLFLSIFILCQSSLSWYFRDSKYYILAFAIFWVLFEWLRSWVFTGFPWNLLGYSFAFSNHLVQQFSVFGAYGVSFIVVFLSASAINLIERERSSKYLVFLLSSILILFAFGELRLSYYETKFHDVKLRLVQANIPQTDKWDDDLFWANLTSHVNLSRDYNGFEPDIILWSEASVTVPYNIASVRQLMQSAIIYPNSVLITGGVSYIDKKLYSSLYSVNQSGDLLFEYHKAHLVPFGEYIPFRTIFPFVKKLTHGFLDYTPGKMGEVFNISNLNLTIRPLICYESIFPREAITRDADVIINLTNDTWYGNSAGPYHHFHMARMRAVENGIPLVRVANSGISAIIDPLGKVIGEAGLLSRMDVIDNYLPKKLENSTFYVKFQELTLLILLLYFGVITKLIYKNR